MMSLAYLFGLRVGKELVLQQLLRDPGLRLSDVQLMLESTFFLHSLLEHLRAGGIDFAATRQDYEAGVRHGAIIEIVLAQFFAKGLIA